MVSIWGSKVGAVFSWRGCVYVADIYYFFLLLIDISQGSYWFAHFSPRNDYWGSETHISCQRLQAVTQTTFNVTYSCQSTWFSSQLQNEAMCVRGCKRKRFNLSWEKQNIIPARRLDHSILLGSEVNNIYIITVMQTLAAYLTKNRYIGRARF